MPHKTINPNFPDEFSDYLEANGLLRTEAIDEFFSSIYFTGFPYLVIVTGNRIDFFIHDDGEEGQRSKGYHKFSSFTGLDQLGIFNFMLLLNVTGIIPLKKFITKCKAERTEEADKFIKKMNEYFVNSALPECY